VQIDPIRTALKAPGSKRLELIYDGPPSNFAFKFNLRRYTKATIELYASIAEELLPTPSKVGRCRLTLSNPR
jgi:hypothetical protein